MPEETKPNCYKCQYRSDVPGSAHSACQHPSIQSFANDPFATVIATLASARNLPFFQAGIDKLGIKANYHGIRHGWFNFPFNFDPVWLEACNGFKPIQTKEPQ